VNFDPFFGYSETTAFAAAGGAVALLFALRFGVPGLYRSVVRRARRRRHPELDPGSPWATRRDRERYGLRPATRWWKP
jgi:hypothetical protein